MKISGQKNCIKSWFLPEGGYSELLAFIYGHCHFNYGSSCMLFIKGASGALIRVAFPESYRVLL